MKLYLASGNAHKAEEFQALVKASGLALEIVSARVVGGMPAVIEDAGTFEGNALKKARALKALVPPGQGVLADDSGLCVEALGGAPGVESAYYAGPQGDSAANLRKLIDAMRAVPAGRRHACFICVLAFIDGEGREHLCEGRCEGSLSIEPKGGHGFGYDPLFIPRGLSQSMAELDAETKNRLSHRGKAWARFVEVLRG